MKYKWNLLILLNCCFFSGHTDENTEKIFSNIYLTGGWGRDDQGKGFSGQGSTLDNTRTYIKFIEEFIKTNKIESVVDLGCGDWVFSQHIQWDNLRYYGVDIVKEVIEEDIRKFSSPNITFIHGDVLDFDFNLPSADLLICKDVLMHLTNADIQTLLIKFQKFKHCLFTHNIDANTLTSSNQDIERGEFRTLDITAPPFNVEGIKILNYFTDHAVKQIVYIRNCQ